MLIFQCLSCNEVDRTATVGNIDDKTKWEFYAGGHGKAAKWVAGDVSKATPLVEFTFEPSSLESILRLIPSTGMIYRAKIPNLYLILNITFLSIAKRILQNVRGFKRILD